MPRNHSGSLVPKFLHDPAMLKLMRQPLTNAMVSLVAAKTVDSVQCRPPPSSSMPSPPQTPGASPSHSPSDPLPSLEFFIKCVVRKSKCHVPTLLCTIIYLDRLKERLPGHARGCHTTRHRVFLATLIVAAKYLNDSSPQNKHWVKYAQHFTSAEVNLMERQLLTIFNFDLRFTESELAHHLRPLLEPIAISPGEAYYPLQPAAQSNYLESQPLRNKPIEGLDTPPETPAEEQLPRIADTLERISRLDTAGGRRDEVVARRPYRPLEYAGDEPQGQEDPRMSSSVSPPQHGGEKRLTPAYRIPAGRGPLGGYSTSSPVPTHRTPPQPPVAPFSTRPSSTSASSYHRPALRTGTSCASLASTASRDSRGSRPPSWSGDEDGSRGSGRHRRSSGESSRYSVSEVATPDKRISHLSTRSSTSTLSSTSSGPRTPSPPLPLPYSSSIPFIPTTTDSPIKPSAPALAAPVIVSHHSRDPSDASSYLHALSFDPDLMSMMSSSGSYAKQDRGRLVKGEMRVYEATERERQGRLGLNLRAGERREAVWA
ncbi:hypothetical protein JCM11251_001762 [Rhodosporidiobolus azoricus]